MQLTIVLGLTACSEDNQTLLFADDPVYLKSAELSQTSLDQLEELCNDYPDSASVLFNYRTKSGERVLVWGKPVGFSEGGIRINLLAGPFWLQDPDSVFEIEKSAVADWAVRIDNNKVKGAFLSQLLLLRKSKQLNDHEVEQMKKFVDKIQ